MTARTRLGLEALDRRDLPSWFDPGITFGGGTILMVGSDKVETAQVWMADGLVHARMVSTPAGGGWGTVYYKTYLPGGVDEVVFSGGGANDSFDNTTYIHSSAWGDAGDDKLYGGNAADELHGGAGHDRVYGNGGGDTIYGEANNDELHGGSGADSVYGGDHHDHLYGGTGADVLSGENGDDRIVSVGGGTDTHTGGSGFDSHWLDPTDALTDSVLEDLMKRVHRVSEFEGYSFDGGATVTPASKELHGQDLPDPRQRQVHEDLLFNNFKSDFSDRPLFAAGGPSRDDVFQNGVGDCYFLARLSALAEANPTFIKQMVVDLGDGTYAVRFYDAGVPRYVRVDGDLWTDNYGNLRYARLGGDGAVWMPIVEKAWAFYRTKWGNYDSIASGVDADYAKMGLTPTILPKETPVSAQAVVDWANAGSPPGLIAYHVRTAAQNWLREVKAARDAGRATTVGAVGGVSDTSELRVDDPTKPGEDGSFRTGYHIYTVDSVQTDATGTPTGITLRDPYGPYRELTDMTRIYFCLSAGSYWTP